MFQNMSYDDAARAARLQERERLAAGLQRLLHAKDQLATDVGELSAALFSETTWRDLDALLCELSMKQGELARVISQIHTQEKLIDDCR